MYTDIYTEQRSAVRTASIPFEAKRVSFLAGQYLRSLRIKRRSSAHLDRVGRSLRYFEKWLADYEHPFLSIELIEDYAFWLMEEARPFAGTPREGEPGSLSVASQRGFLIDLRSFLKWCLTREHIPCQAHRWIPVPSLPKTGVKRASNEDIRRILMVASDNLRDYAICSLLIDCGLRAGELGCLLIENCDLESRAISVTGKTGFRTLAISEQATQVLDRWIGCQQRDTGYVFPGRKDGHLSASGIYQIMVRLRKQAQVQGRVNPHAWRHAYISNTAVRGGNAALTQLQAGHASIATTEQYFGFGLAELRDYQDRVTSLPDLAPDIPPDQLAAPLVRPRPTKEELAASIQECSNWEALGRRYGVSGVAVKKWAKKWDILDSYQRPNQGTDILITPG